MKKWLCSKCYTDFDSIEILEKHSFNHSNESHTKIFCTICGYETSSRNDNWKRHILNLDHGNAKKRMIRYVYFYFKIIL